MMKKISLRIGALLLVLCMTFGCLAGCGKGDDSSTPLMEEEVLGEYFVEDETESKEDSTDTQSADSTTTSSGSTGGSASTGSSKIDIKKLKGQTVNMMMWRELNQAEKTVLKNFQSSTGINVKYSVVNQKEYLTKVAAEIAGGTGLDICAIQSGGMSILTSDTYPSSFPI